jgi:hypothetical protein
MDKTLFDKDGEAVAYLTEDYHGTIYLWDGEPVAYLYDEKHVYGMSGRHLGWFVDEVLFNNDGERAGFTTQTCPVSIAKEPPKWKRRAPVQIRPRWTAPPFPKTSFDLARQGLADFLKEGRIAGFGEESPEQATPDSGD